MKKIAATRNYKAAGMFGDTKQSLIDSLAGYLREEEGGAAMLASKAPYGTQTVVEKAIQYKADEIAACIVNIADPFNTNT
jgi:hypothetical protein